MAPILATVTFTNANGVQTGAIFCLTQGDDLVSATTRAKGVLGSMHICRL
jgi:hypothetical protein